MIMTALKMKNSKSTTIVKMWKWSLPGKQAEILENANIEPTVKKFSTTSGAEANWCTFPKSCCWQKRYIKCEKGAGSSLDWANVSVWKITKVSQLINLGRKMCGALRNICAIGDIVDVFPQRVVRRTLSKRLFHLFGGSLGHRDGRPNFGMHLIFPSFSLNLGTSCLNSDPSALFSHLLSPQLRKNRRQERLSGNSQPRRGASTGR